MTQCPRPAKVAGQRFVGQSNEGGKGHVRKAIVMRITKIMARVLAGVWALMKILTVTVATLLIIGAICFSYFVWNFNRWPFDLDKLELLTDDMTMQEVKGILGKPGIKDFSTKDIGT